MSTTIESQPQRAMLSAEAELGIPSQPLTATPPFFQSVFSLFSRKASLPLSVFRAPQWAWARLRVNAMLRLTPHANAADDPPPAFPRALLGAALSQSDQ